MNLCEERGTTRTDGGETVLRVHRLSVAFRSHGGIVRAVNDVSWHLKSGETLAIVGESGCGKTVSAKAVMRLLPEDGAFIDQERSSVHYGGRNLLSMSQRELSDIRGREISMIFQDPMTSLNPTMNIGNQIAESVRIHQGKSRREALDVARTMLEKVKIPRPEERLRQYPFEFSGGMRQRAMIAMALCLKPKILIADEPTTALDVTIQAQILQLMRELRDEMGMSVVLVTHDLGVVASVADRIHVMYAGHIVEKGNVFEIYQRPSHPYTKALLESVPTLRTESKSQLYAMEGRPLDLTLRQKGCPFAPRCRYAMKICERAEAPPWRFSPTQSCYCWLHHPEASHDGVAESLKMPGERMGRDEEGAV